MDATALKKAWMNLVPATASRQVPKVASRLFWVGLPNQDTKDVLGLQGMELRLTWRELGQSIIDEVIVSQIVFHQFICSFIDPENSRVSWHDYSISIIQSADLDSAYGQLIQRQRIAGIKLDEKLHVTEQLFRIRIIIGPLPDNVKPHFRRYLGDHLPATTMRDGIKFSPPDVKLDELGYLPNDKLLPDARRRLLKRRDSLFDSLSDVAIDRIYELQAMIAAWHLNLKDNKIKRQKKSREVKRSREQLSLERAQQAQLIMECRDAIENVQKELSKLKGHSACLVKVDPSSDPAIEPLKALILSTEQEIAVVVQEIETLKSELPMVIKKWGMGDKFRSVSSRKEAVEQKLNDLMSRLTDLKLQMQTHFDGAEENFKQKRVKVLAQIEEREREVEALNERLKLLESHLLQIDGKIALARIEVETYS